MSYYKTIILKVKKFVIDDSFCLRKTLKSLKLFPNTQNLKVLSPSPNHSLISFPLWRLKLWILHSQGRVASLPLLCLVSFLLHFPFSSSFMDWLGGDFFEFINLNWSFGLGYLWSCSELVVVKFPSLAQVSTLLFSP